MQRARWLVTAALATLPPLASADTPEFFGLGLPAWEVLECRVTAVSADGTLVFGTYVRRDGTGRPYPTGFKWTPTNGFEDFPNAGPISLPSDTSLNGSTVVGTITGGPGPGGVDLLAGFWWSPKSGFQYLTTPGIGISSATGCSADGSIVAGNTSQQGPVLWTPGKAIDELPDLGTALADGVSDISADGSVVAGWVRHAAPLSTEACVWIDGVPRGLGWVPGGPQRSVALAVSADGQVVAGDATDSTQTSRAFFARVSGAGGLKLPAIPPGFSRSTAKALSGNGARLVFEADNSITDSRVFTWDRIRGSRDLKQTLLLLGVSEVTGWTLRWAGAITPDGTVIVGGGLNPQGQSEAWLARIPAVCYANCDGSVIEPNLNVADFSCFINRFAANDPYANCDDSTIAPVLNVQDFSCFVSTFVAGCP